MKPYEIIKKQNQVIDSLKYELKFAKDKVKSSVRINALIDGSNCLNELLTQDYKTDALNRLLYALIYEWLLQFKVGEGKEIPLTYMMHNLREDLQHHSDHKKAQILDILKSNYDYNLIKDNKFGLSNNYPNFEELLNEITTNLKEDIQYGI